MKKLSLLASFILIAVISANAQVDFKLGWVYAFDVEDGGLQLGAEYDLNSQLELAAGLSIIFQDDAPGVDRDFWMVDVDGHYLFNPSTGLFLYPLAGLNFSTASYKIDGSSRQSDTEIGLNLGGGAQFRIVDRLKAFIELKYIIGDYDQGVLGLGIAYRVN